MTKQILCAVFCLLGNIGLTLSLPAAGADWASIPTVDWKKGFMTVAERRALTDAMREVVARLAKDYDAVHIRTQDIFDAASADVPPENWMWGGIHPLPPGHELIARHWLKNVSVRWPLANR